MTSRHSSILTGARSLLRGLALLRYPEVVEDLGERRLHLLRLHQIRALGRHQKIATDLILGTGIEEHLQLGSRVSIGSGTQLTCGDETFGWGRIEIGSDTWIGPFNNLRAGNGTIQIGKGCLISQYCSLLGTNHGTDRDLPILAQAPSPSRRDIVLGDDVWLGAGVTITPGIKIGTGSVIGAGAVVTHDVQDFEIHAGCPARKIGERASSGKG